MLIVGNDPADGRERAVAGRLAARIAGGSWAVGLRRERDLRTGGGRTPAAGRSARRARPTCCPRRQPEPPARHIEVIGRALSARQRAVAGARSRPRSGRPPRRWRAGSGGSPRWRSGSASTSPAGRGLDPGHGPMLRHGSPSPMRSSDRRRGIVVVRRLARPVWSLASC